MITIAVAFVAVECTNVWLTGEHVLKTFENVVSIQKSKCSVSKLVKRTNEFKYFFWIMFNIIWFWEYCG